MPAIDYLMLTVLSLMGASPGGALPATRTFSAAAITQPAGGAPDHVAVPVSLLIPQDTGGDKGKLETGKKPLKTKTRHHRTGTKEHKGGKVNRNTTGQKI